VLTPGYLNCTTSYSSTQTLQVRVYNRGLIPISNIPITAEISGATSATLTDLITSTIPGQSYVDFTFSSTFDLSAEGIYHFKIYTQLGNEKYFINDTLREGRHSRVLTLPYVENFNQSNGGWQTGGTGLREWGTTAKMGGSGTPAWVTRLSGSYNDNENAWLLSPPFDLSGLNADPVVSYNIKYSTEACCDRVYYEYSVDGGTTWSTLRTLQELQIIHRFMSLIL